MLKPRFRWICGLYSMISLSALACSLAQEDEENLDATSSSENPKFILSSADDNNNLVNSNEQINSQDSDAVLIVGENPSDDNSNNNVNNDIVVDSNGDPVLDSNGDPVANLNTDDIDEATEDESSYDIASFIPQPADPWCVSLSDQAAGGVTITQANFGTNEVSELLTVSDLKLSEPALTPSIGIIGDTLFTVLNVQNVGFRFVAINMVDGTYELGNEAGPFMAITNVGNQLLVRHAIDVCTHDSFFDIVEPEPLTCPSTYNTASVFAGYSNDQVISSYHSGSSVRFHHLEDGEVITELELEDFDTWFRGVGQTKNHVYVLADDFGDQASTIIQFDLQTGSRTKEIALPWLDATADDSTIPVSPGRGFYGLWCGSKE